MNKYKKPLLKGGPSSIMFMKLNKNQKKGFNQMMSILMLGLISAGGGVGVATFAQDQQSGLTQTTGGAGLRESVTLENISLETNSGSSQVSVVVRNVGVVDVELGAIYMNGTNVSLTSFTVGSTTTTTLQPGEAGEVTFDTGGSLEAGSVQTFKVTTKGGGVVSTTATVSQN